jgi:hypothetical protein
MKVLLHDTENGLYYRGDSGWTPERSEALNLVRREAAVRLASNLCLESAEVVLSFGAPYDDVILRLRTPWHQNKTYRLMIAAAAA